MLKPFTLAVTLTALLGGCGAVRDSAFNPVNWFGRGQEVPAEQAASAVPDNPLIPERTGLLAQRRAQLAQIDRTSPIAQITALRIEPVPGGAIIRAEGLDTYATSFNAVLTPDNEDERAENGVLSYSFRREVPEGAVPGGAVGPREITVARFVSEQTLRGVRSIRVAAANNAQAARR